MKQLCKTLGFALLLLAGQVARADFQVLAVLQITNTPAPSPTNIVINAGTADTRSWTNGVLNPSTQIQITNSASAARTNLLVHFATYPVLSSGPGTPQLNFDFNATNVTCVNILAPFNTNLTVTLGGNWGFIIYYTNVYSAATAILSSTNAMSSQARTNAGNAIVNLLSAMASTASNAIPLGAVAFRNYLDTNTAQVVGNKTLIGPVISGGRITGFTNAWGTNVAVTNGTLYLMTISGSTFTGSFGNTTNGTIWAAFIRASTNYGYIGALSNGLLYANILQNPVSTNLTNFGLAITSPGSGASSEQFGAGSTATGDFSFASGPGATANKPYALAIGGAEATGTNAVAVGNGAEATVTDSVAVGRAAVVTGQKGIAVGTAATSNHSNSWAIAGNTSAVDQGMLGTSGHTILVPGVLQVSGTQTNTTFTGTNNWNGDLAYSARTYSGLVNGFNTGILLGTNVVVELSGGTTIATIGSFIAERNGAEHEIRLSGGITNVIANESGAESVNTSYRITTGTGADVPLTNQPAWIRIRYRTASSRWELMSWSK